MDPISVIAADALTMLAAAAEGCVTAVCQVVVDSSAALVSVAAPAVQPVASGVIALHTMCGPQLFASVLLFSGAFALLALGSLVGHRYS